MTDIILLLYGLAFCIFILLQGFYYWRLKYRSLSDKPINQEQGLSFFRKMKSINIILILFMPIIVILQFYLYNWDVDKNKVIIFLSLVANIFAILEYINYYKTQLMIDNKYDLHYVLKNRKLKIASLKKDLMANKI